MSRGGAGNRDVTRAREHHELGRVLHRTAFLQRYTGKRWQALQWHKLSACIVLEQRGRRAFRGCEMHSGRATTMRRRSSTLLSSISRLLKMPLETFLEENTTNLYNLHPTNKFIYSFFTCKSRLTIWSCLHRFAFKHISNAYLDVLIITD